MTSGTHALILAQSAFEAVCKERDEIKTQADNLAKELEASKAYAERCKQGCIKLSFAIDRIDYACGEPNEMEVSDYCIHQNEEHVVKRVKEKIEAWRKERDEALALLASEKSTRNAIIAKGTKGETMSTELRPTPETDAAIKSAIFNEDEDHERLAAVSRKLERERDEARERERVAVASWDEERLRGQREAERVVALQHQLEALRKTLIESEAYQAGLVEAIEAMRGTLQSIEADARDLRKFKKFPESVESLACSILFKLKPFLP